MVSFQQMSIKNAIFFTHIVLLALNAGGVVLGFAEDVLFEEIGVLSGCTDEAHILQLGDSFVEVLCYLFIKSLWLQIFVKVAFLVHNFERVMQGYQVDVSPLVHHELHEDSDVLSGALDCQYTFLLIDTPASNNLIVALVLLFQLFALLFDSLDIVKDRGLVRVLSDGLMALQD